jgi:hypothetical protein
MENQKPVSPSWQCSSTPVGFGQGSVSKEQYDNTGASPILSSLGSSWFLPVPSIEITIEGTALLWCYWHNKECDGRAEKAFIKWRPGMFLTLVQLLEKVNSWTMGLFFRNCSSSDCTILYFSEIKWFREHFVATTYWIPFALRIIFGYWH